MMSDEQQPIFDQHDQHNYGTQYNAVGDINIIYQQARATPADPATIAKVCALLALLPTDQVPPLAPLPPGSKAPGRVLTFVGRAPDMWAIAATLAGGDRGATGRAVGVAWHRD